MAEAKPQTFIREGDYYVEEGRTGEGFILATAGDNVYIQQGRGRTAYGIIWLSPDSLELQPFCANYSDATLAKHGLAVDKKLVCWVKTLDQLVALSKEKPEGQPAKFKIITMEK